MKYYSEITKQYYDTAEDCLKADVEATKKLEAQEAEKKKKEAEFKERLEECLAADETVRIAKAAAAEAWKKLAEDYGHGMTISSNMPISKSLIDWIFDLDW